MESEPLISSESERRPSNVEKVKTYLQKPAVKAGAGVTAFLLAALLFIASTSIISSRHELEPLSRVATVSEGDQLSKMYPHDRLILVGDVHGMYKELRKLLKKVDYRKNKDRIVFLGDMITKGPDSLKVVDFAIDHEAYCVRGNHEDEIFRLYADYHNLDDPLTYVPYASESTIVQGSKPTVTLKHDYATTGPYPTGNAIKPQAGNEKRDMPLVKKLKQRHINYLQRCPAILRLGPVSKRGIEAVAVHGGLLWHEHELEKQAIEDVLRLRSIVPPDYTHGSEDPDAGEPWFNRYNEEQHTRPKNERYEVFYGHDASKGLQLRRYSKGLDTKCQRGGKLSAYVVEVDHMGHFHERLVQIKC